MSQIITVIVVDDHALVRDSLEQLLSTAPDIRVVASACNGNEALGLVDTHEPTIVLMDIDMPGMNCFDAAERIMAGHPATRVMFLSAFCYDHHIERALRLQVRGFLAKTESMDSVIHGIRQVAEGKVVFSEKVSARIVADGSGARLAEGAGRTRAATLSARETEVLGYLARGLSKKEIAQVMFLSVKTVEGHADRLMDKLDVHNRVELARFAIREGLVSV